MFLSMLTYLFLSHFSAHALPDAATLPDLSLFLQKAKSSYIQHPTHKKMRNHYYSLNEGQSKAIVFLPGLGEAALKYYELPDSLQIPNATFYLWDHIGQGFSSHMLPAEPKKVHIDSFRTHIVALQYFLQSLRQSHQEIIVIGHSMGAHLALLLASENPELFNQVVLSSPFINIRKTWIPVPLLTWILNLFPETSYPPFYFLFSKKTDDVSHLTHSLERQKQHQKTIALYPTLERKGATIGWIKAAQNSVRKMSVIDLKLIPVPISILQAESDLLVSNEKQIDICKKLPRCQLEKIPGSLH
jgi:lysophospholipase